VGFFINFSGAEPKTIYRIAQKLIVASLMDKLFDPFFTTKPDGEGTGLGLSICQGILETHGGLIWTENSPDGGAVFIVRLSAEEKENECQPSISR
jgi:K+-sensing histidine kinase KdpD